MPYIKKDRRAALSAMEFPENPETVGELNYMITMLMKEFVGRNPTYGDINDAIGACEAAKLEFYRRVAIPYEDVKIKENGDVY